MIPKIIHQFWIGPKKMPLEWMETWKKFNPSWEYKLWTEETLKDFNPENESIISQLKEYHGIKDVYQYEIMKRYGGFFIDADSICLRPIPEYLTRFEAFTCYEGETVKPGYLALGYVGAKPNHPVFDKIIEDLKTLTVYEPAWSTIGQLMWTKHAQDRNDIICLPSTMFIPVHYSNAVNGGDSNSIATQFWGSTLNLYKNS